MGCCGKVCALIFAISTLITAITALGLTGYFTKPHCSKGVECEGDAVKEFCSENGAYAVSTVVGVGTAVATASSECPWRSITYVIAILALVVVFILVLLIVVAACKNISLKCSITLVGLAAIILILVGSGLMVKDLVDGLKYYADTFEGTDFVVFQPVKYAVNIAMMVATLFSTITSICCGVSLSKTNSSLVSAFKVSGANSSRNSNFQSVPNTSNVMTAGNNTSMGYNNNGYPNGHNTSMGHNNSGYNQPMRGGYQQNQMQPQYPQRR
jgi:magnesium-transporting ATPase (P-type)